MTLAELHRNFKIELDKSSISSYPSFLPEEIDYWLNTAVIRLIKTKYSGRNSSRIGYQENQKRTDDLRMSTKIKDFNVVEFVDGGSYFKDQLVISNGIYYISTATHTASGLSLFIKTSLDENSLWVEFPSDYIVLIGESVYISSKSECWPKVSNSPKIIRTDVIESTIENLDSKLSNSLSDHRLNSKRAKPIRVISENKIKLYTDGNYQIDKYSIEYIYTPDKFNWYDYVQYSQANALASGSKIFVDGYHQICNYNKPAGESLDKTKISKIQLTTFPEHVWDELVVLSVRLALENISEPRYQTYASESQLVE